MDRLIKALDKLSPKCREEKIEIFIHLINIHLQPDKNGDMCVECDLKQGIKKVEW